jgi:hypothetical protein
MTHLTTFRFLRLGYAQGRICIFQGFTSYTQRHCDMTNSNLSNLYFVVNFALKPLPIQAANHIFLDYILYRLLRYNLPVNDERGKRTSSQYISVVSIMQTVTCMSKEYYISLSILKMTEFFSKLSH